MWDGSARNANDHGTVLQRSSVPAFQRSSMVDMFVDALNRFTQVRELWQAVTSFYEGRAHMRDVLDSVLEGATDKYCVDSRELNVRVPDLLMRECEDEIHRVSDLHSRVTRVEIKSVYKTEIGDKNDHPIPCKYVNIDDKSKFAIGHNIKQGNKANILYFPLSPGISHFGGGFYRAVFPGKYYRIRNVGSLGSAV